MLGLGLGLGLSGLDYITALSQKRRQVDLKMQTYTKN